MDSRKLIDSTRERMSKLSSIFALSMVMFDRTYETEIIQFAADSVAALGSARTEGAYLLRDDLRRVGDGSAALQLRLRSLAGSDGSVHVAGAPWARAYALRAVGGHAGYLVVTADTEPPMDQQYLLRTLAQQIGAALNSARFTWRERRNVVELRNLNTRLSELNEQLTNAVADLERRRHADERLNAVAASGGGEAGIANSLHNLTGLAVAIEDTFGNLLEWCGPGRPMPYPRMSPHRRSELLTAARRSGRPIRQRDRFVALAQPRNEVLGVLVLIDPDHRAVEHDLFALEHAAVVLAMELAHRRGMAETELRLRGDLVHDLLTGTDDESARFRSTALGHDLSLPHQVLVMQWPGAGTGELVARTIERVAATMLDTGVLLSWRAGAVDVLTPSPGWTGMRWRELYRSISTRLQNEDGAIGVGGSADVPSKLPRSYSEALRALRIRQESMAPNGVTVFDNLGIYRLLATGDGDRDRELREFVREWLGPLVDYDAAHRSDLVTTLWQYYECGGNYDMTACALAIHRSTLRYRLRRIRELTGRELGDVENRLNLHVATRAWQILRGSD
ncbi:PucR family transcriptional regulator [Pseudonocardia aurantiaca]|uniref:PucR family transcriptional regulator n=1 Tax=Pseudonocardia aurantiaca TaxID=75290 RepID=A0ABW4FTC4_9PSEU